MEKAARVSDLADTAGVRTIDSPPQDAFVAIFYHPDENSPTIDKPTDVVIYNDQRVAESAHGFFERKQAAERAVEEAIERNVPLLKHVYVFEEDRFEKHIDDVKW
ncbi:hypothetical protein [Haloarcula argentinensis]|uniref:Uncharacterized protein n=1 Tax=Haloarcula argentinensis TaxID=43776 RepID=A0A847UIX2_HALAR|nr:hypothetical protein [Haloarcula argentinensis]NLV12197.1 hypothetical protein [Haloarcula argentinensis]